MTGRVWAGREGNPARVGAMGSIRTVTTTVSASWVVALWVSLATPGLASAQEQTNEESVSLTDTIPEASLEDMVDAGADLFNGGTCIFCHAVGGRGDGRRGPDLTDVEWLHSDGSFEEILRTITWGVRRDEIKAVTPRPFPMNPSGGMSVSFRERQAIAAYVWSLAHGRQTAKVKAQNEFLTLLERGRTAEAKTLFERERRSHAGSLIFSEQAINTLGYEFLRQREEPEIAIEVFKLNAELHPDSWNVWDSLAEGYMVAGDDQRAIELYEKSLQLNPDNQNGKEMLAKLRGG